MIKRRHHTLEFKQQLVAECSGGGASVAGVALAHGINANQLHKWRRNLLPAKTATRRDTLLPVTVEPASMTLDVLTAESYPGAIEIEVPNARLTLRGRVDLDALQTVLAVLLPR